MRVINCKTFHILGIVNNVYMPIEYGISKSINVPKFVVLYQTTSMAIANQRINTVDNKVYCFLKQPLQNHLSTSYF